MHRHIVAPRSLRFILALTALTGLTSTGCDVARYLPSAAWAARQDEPGRVCKPPAKAKTDEQGIQIPAQDCATVPTEPSAG